MPQPCTLPDLAFVAGEQIRDLGVALVAAAETETADAPRVLALARATVDRAMPLMLEAAGRLVVPWRDDAPSAGPLDVALLAAQHEFSLRTFGPGARAKGVVAHIRKELEEVEAAPGDLAEWVDVMILAADGAMRAGHDPAALLAGYRAKLARNFARKWPDWRTLPADAPIEHDRAADAPSPLEEAREIAADLYAVLADTICRALELMPKADPERREEARQ